jgi:hypothetical protein
MHNARIQPSSLWDGVSAAVGGRYGRTRQETTIEFRGCDEQAGGDVGS